MKILFTGCSDQVGWKIYQRISQFDGFLIIPTNSKMLDITNISAIRYYQDKRKPNIIINAAAYTTVDKAESNSDDGVATWYNLARLIIAYGHGFASVICPPYIEPITTSEYPTPAPRPANSALDCSKFIQTLLHIEVTDWSSGLRKMAEHLSRREN